MVNIKDIDEFEEKDEGKTLEDVFEKQKKLMEKYKKIENLPDKIELDDRAHQRILKDFAFRGIEELAEAFEAFANGDNEHFIEEIADAMHFFTELMILSNISEENFVYPKFKDSDDKYIDLIKNFDKMSILLWDVTYRFAIACNCLKLKAWKQTDVKTDAIKYKSLMIDAYKEFLDTLSTIGFTEKQAIDIYFKKSNVNLFRIRSKY